MVDAVYIGEGSVPSTTVSGLPTGGFYASLQRVRTSGAA